MCIRDRGSVASSLAHPVEYDEQNIKPTNTDISLDKNAYRNSFEFISEYFHRATSVDLEDNKGSFTEDTTRYKTSEKSADIDLDQSIDFDYVTIDSSRLNHLTIGRAPVSTGKGRRRLPTKFTKNNVK